MAHRDFWFVELVSRLLIFIYTVLLVTKKRLPQYILSFYSFIYYFNLFFNVGWTVEINQLTLSFLGLRF